MGSGGIGPSVIQGAECCSSIRDARQGIEEIPGAPGQAIQSSDQQNISLLSEARTRLNAARSVFAPLTFSLNIFSARLL
jgi:hypothetical protein